MKLNQVKTCSFDNIILYIYNLYKTGKLFNHKWHLFLVRKIAFCEEEGSGISMSYNDVAKSCAKYVTFLVSKICHKEF